MGHTNFMRAIKRIDPNAEFLYSEGDEISQIRWHTDPVPEADILAKQKEMDVEYEANKYQRDRKSEYDLLNQFEMQFDDQRDGTSTWVDAINAIKDKHPKP